MTHRMFLTGCIVLYAAIFMALLPTRLREPPEQTFSSDALHYHLGAVSLVTRGSYSLDGETPFTEREPGMSVFLALLYAVFGIGNRAAIFVAQGLLYLLASLLFVQQVRRLTSAPTAGLSLVFLLIFPPALHAVFSVYRESLALSLLLLFAALFLGFERARSLGMAAALGLLLGMIILTYVPFLFLPFFLAGLCVFLGMERKYTAMLLLLPFLLVGFWSLRNGIVNGQFRPVGSLRTAVIWYARAEQAEQVQGLEPLRCLVAEYVSRDWSGRSPACSTTALFHKQWPDGIPRGDESTIARESVRKILRFFPQYFWFSLFEVLELHLPYVNGWGFWYNLVASVSTLFLYVGCLLSLPHVWKREYALFLLLILYSTVVFALTDATPRYLLPVIFCYAVLAAVGYTESLRRFRSQGEA